MMGRIQRSSLAVGVIVTALTLIPIFCVSAQNKSDRERDNLIGQVHIVLLQTASIMCGSGKCVEGKRNDFSREEYDISGRVTGERNRFTINDPRARMFLYPFDESIPRIERPIHGEDGTLLYTDVYIYDNKERRAEHVNYDAWGAARFRVLVVFDEPGRFIEENTYDGVGNLEAWIKLTRDERGNVVEGEEGEGTICRKDVYTYEFDHVGNWIKETRSTFVISNGRFTQEPSGVRYRTITYYLDTLP